MRGILLASVAALSANGVIDGAMAQSSTVPGAPTQGQLAYPAVSPPVAANNNNNAQARVLQGPAANPTPGTIVVHVNGRVMVELQGVWSSADQRAFTAPAAGSLGATLGNNGTGTAKLQPQNISSYARIYLGADGMATNGLRYGAAIEARENFTGQPSGASASTYSSMETMFVRRAFTYVAGSDWGILRAGQADGIIGIFDNGITTTQFLPTMNLDGGDLQNFPSNAIVPYFFLSLGGAEYANSKFVYLTPQFSGVDFGIQYAPTIGNGFGLSNSFGSLGGSITGSGTGTGINCTTATTGCPTLSSGPGALDGSRIINQTVLGVRYQGSWNDVGVLAYAAYEFSGNSDYSGAAATTAAGATNLGISTLPGSKYTGHYNGLNFGNGGLAVTYAGLTLAGNVIGGRVNSQLALTPVGGANELAYTIGAKYVVGPWTLGVVGEVGWYQGSVQMTGISQRRGRGIDAGVGYSLAPGDLVFAEYLWNDVQQGGVNMITGANGSNANNNIKGQGIMLGDMVNF